MLLSTPDMQVMRLRFLLLLRLWKVDLSNFYKHRNKLMTSCSSHFKTPNIVTSREPFEVHTSFNVGVLNDIWWTHATCDTYANIVCTWRGYM